MTWSVLPLVCSLCLLAWGLYRSDYALSFATFFASATLWFMIRGLIVADQHELAPESTRAVASIYVAACVIGVGIGWARPLPWLEKRLSSNLQFPPVGGLVKYCIIAMVFSLFFAWKMRNHLAVSDPSDLKVEGGWSGPHVIYLFLTQPGYFVTSVAAVAYIQTRKPVFAVLAALAVLVYMLPPILAGRREKTIEAAVLGLSCWAIINRKFVPRPVLVIGGVFLATLFSSIAVYRSSIRSDASRVEAVSRALTADDGGRDLSQKYQEVNNYLAVVHNVIHHGRMPNFGMYYWNKLVFAYVPGQIVGRDFKESLQIQEIAVSRDEVRELGFRAGTGTTFSGFSDTLQAFWFFGPLAFYFLSRYVATVYTLAGKGSAICVFAYPFLLVDSTLAVTHSLSRPIHGTINLIVFMAIWIWWIERTGPSGQRGGAVVSG